MKFAHLADVHIGAWRDPRMKELAIEAFEKTILEIIDLKVFFVLIAGDLFNTSIPPLDQVKRAVSSLKKLKQNNIPVYAIAGSHDYSASGKTMLDILEEADLLTLVTKGFVDENNKLHLKFTIDPKTKIKITGILGRKGSLDKHYYEDLAREELEKKELENEKKIFMFHTALNELKPKELEKMDANPASIMPKGFDYYAGGHVHIVDDCTLPGYKKIVYPGPLFPASFSELEKLSSGSYCLVDYDDFSVDRKKLVVKESLSLKIDSEKKTAEKINLELLELIDNNDFKDKIVLLRISGKLVEGRISDIRLKDFSEKAYSKGAYFIMRNTNQLLTPEFEEVFVQGTEGQVEDKLIEEHLGQFPINDLSKEEEKVLTKELLSLLGESQNDGEKKYEYDDRVKINAKSLLDKN